jgi:hypothetical protein
MAVSRPSWPRRVEGVPPSNRGQDARDTKTIPKAFGLEIGVPKRIISRLGGPATRLYYDCS